MMHKKWREKFEACVREDYRNIPHPDFTRDGFGLYVDRELQCAWCGFCLGYVTGWNDGQEVDPHGTALDMDESRIDRIAASHGDGEHYGEVGK